MTTQTLIPIDKTLRMTVKLVTLEGDELPLKGLMLVSEERLILLEKLAADALELILCHEAVLHDISKGPMLEKALQSLRSNVNHFQQL